MGERVNAFAYQDRQGIATLKGIWGSNAVWFIKAWRAERDGKGEHSALDAYGSPETFNDFLTERTHALPLFREPTGESTTEAAIQKLEFWISCIIEKLPQRRRKEIGDTRAKISQVRELHDRARRQYLLEGITHAGAALHRLRGLAAGLLPAVVGWNPNADTITLLEKASQWWVDSQVSQAVFSRDEKDLARLPAYVEQMRRDVDLVNVELLRRVGLAISYRSLMLRFKARCERFDAESLRGELASLGRNAKPEDFLTQRCARYLFDQGLNPLFNAPIIKLRPDIYDASGRWTLYVEAKQYSTGNGLKARLVRAAWQVWSTWAELEGAQRLSEGFLLVFRLGGPLIHFDAAARFQNRTLYPVVVDLAPASARGHAEKVRPIQISAAELVPGSSR